MRKYLFLLLIPIGFLFKYYLEGHPNMSDDELTFVIMIGVLFVFILPVVSFVNFESEKLESEKIKAEKLESKKLKQKIQ